MLSKSVRFAAGQRVSSCWSLCPPWLHSVSLCLWSCLPSCCLRSCLPSCWSLWPCLPSVSFSPFLLVTVSALSPFCVLCSSNRFICEGHLPPGLRSCHTVVAAAAPICLPLSPVPCGCFGRMILRLSPTVSTRLWVLCPLSPVCCGCFGRKIFTLVFRLSPTISSSLWVLWPHDFTGFPWGQWAERRAAMDRAAADRGRSVGECDRFENLPASASRAYVPCHGGRSAHPVLDHRQPPHRPVRLGGGHGRTTAEVVGSNRLRSLMDCGSKIRGSPKRDGSDGQQGRQRTPTSGGSMRHKHFHESHLTLVFSATVLFPSFSGFSL